MHTASLSRLVPTLGVAAALGLAASACGVTTTTTSTTARAPATTAKAAPTTAKAAPTTASAAATAATGAITTTWTEFFSYATPETTRIMLLQDGTKYASVIAGVIGSFPKGLSATVTKVQPSGTTATVTYSLQASSGTLLSGLTGMAVESGGKWLVSATTFCGLAALAGGTCPT